MAKPDMEIAVKKRAGITSQVILLAFFCVFIGFGFTLGAHYANYLIGVWF